MRAENDNVVGEVNLGPSTRLVFFLSTYQGRRYAHARKFVTTNRYTGPAPAGIALTGDPLSQLVGALRKLAGSVPASGETCVAAFQKNKGTEIRIGLVPPDAETALPSVDIREHVTSETYRGFTRKGIRFSWDRLPEVVRLFEVQLAALGVATAQEPTLFPQVQPNWVEKAKIADAAAQAPSPLDDLLGHLPEFPRGFQPPDATTGVTIELPSDALAVKVDRLGHWFVASLSGFERRVQNEVEGKFLLYAQQRGQTEVTLPKAMIHIFKAVAAYEKYCRELHQRIVRNLETKSGNRQLADFQTRQLLEKHRLPCL